MRHEGGRRERGRESLYLILMAGSSEARLHYSQTCMAKVIKLLKREAGRETEGLKTGKAAEAKIYLFVRRGCAMYPSLASS